MVRISLRIFFSLVFWRNWRQKHLLRFTDLFVNCICSRGVWFWSVRFRPELWFPSLAYLRACVGWTNCLTYWLDGIAACHICALVWLSESFLFPWWWRLVPVASRMWLKVAVLATWPVTLQKCNQLSQSTLVWAKCNWWHFVTFFNDSLSRGVLIQNGWCYSIRHYVTFPFPCDSFCLWLTLKEH